MAVNALINLQGIVFHRSPDRNILDHLDLELPEGDRVGLIGHNGSGKTTLLHLIVGLLKPQAGRIEVFGVERKAEEDFHEVRAGAGLLFQDPEDQLFCPTVAEDIAFGPLNLGKTREEAVEIARETLDMLGLNGFEDRVTYRLSYGEKRLVSLATLLAMHPRVLLLDEPTTGLDHDVRERLTRILAAMDTPMLVVSHDDSFLQRITSRRVLLENGRITAIADD